LINEDKMREPISNANQEALTPAVIFWSGLGTVVQVGLVVVGHYSNAVYSMWPTLLLLISTSFAAAYVIQVRRSAGDSAWHGGMVGGICAFLGVALATILADAPAMDLFTVTLTAIVTAALVGWVTFVVVCTV
tara:strand:+ start:20730 stop:21128 length:399 start_codon:yes stop_codon:yes gene_type:complete